MIEVDNGTEFTSSHFDAWADMRDIQIDFISPRRPVENCYIDSYNSSVRDVLLNVDCLQDLDEAKHCEQAWRRDYNDERSQFSLG